jgi:hypothetical protein
MPPDDIAGRLTDLSQRVVPPQSSFRIDGVSRKAHVTLYMGNFNADRISQLERRIAAADLGCRAARCDAASISLTAGGYVEVGYSKTEVLVRLQESVASIAADLALPADLPAHVTPTENLEYNIRRYKYELIGDSFRPHATLGCLAPGGEALLPSVRLDQFSFSTARLLIGDADENGSVRAIRAQVLLESGPGGGPVSDLSR